METVCPNCKTKVQFRFHFDYLPGDYREYYPNECPNCGCHTNYTGAWIPAKGKKKRNWLQKWLNFDAKA